MNLGRIAVAAAVVTASIPVQAQVNAPTLTLTQEMRIDGVARNLVPVSWMLVARDGSLVVAQPMDTTILFFSADGAPTGRFGRKGQGPGEFGNLARMGWIGDTVWVFDAPNRRVTLVSPQHTFLRDYGVQRGMRPVGPDTARYPTYSSNTPLQAYANGQLLVSGFTPATQPVPKGYDPASTPIFRMDSTGRILRKVGELPDLPSDLGLIAVQGEGTTGIPQFSMPQRGYAPDGSRIAIVRTQVVSARGGTFSVVELGSMGDTVVSRSFPFVGAPIPASVTDSTRALMRSRAVTGNRSGIAAAIEKASFPLVYPPLTDVAIGSDGSTWIGLRPTAGGHPYLLLDPRGAPVGSVTIAGRGTVRAANATNVWVVELDADDVPSIVRYRVNKP